MAANTNFYDKMCCYEHPETDLIEDYSAGDMICPECGLVVGDRVIDVSTEWRTFSNSESFKSDRNCCGGPKNPLLNGNNLTTIIGPGTGAEAFDQNSVAKYNNHRQKKSSYERSLITGFKEISAMAGHINLTQSIIDRTNNLFKVLHGGNYLRRRSIYSKAAACVYLACRQENIPRTFKEICAISKVHKKEIGRCYKSILSALNTNAGLIKTDDFMSRFCGNLNLSKAIQCVATHIAKQAVDLNIVPGRSPISIAATAIYMAAKASGEKVTQKEVGDITGVAEITIRQFFKEMSPQATKLFPIERLTTL